MRSPISCDCVVVVDCGVCSHTKRDPAELAAIAGTSMMSVASTIVKPSVHAADAMPAVLTRVALNCDVEFVPHTSQYTPAVKTLRTRPRGWLLEAATTIPAVVVVPSSNTPAWEILAAEMLARPVPATPVTPRGSR